MSADSALAAALEYAVHVPVFPCRPNGPKRRTPFTPHGHHDATIISDIVTQWWTIWPLALIGMPTGQASGRVVLDIDVKNPAANGLDTLADLGLAVLPDTPIAHTPSGGLHLYFRLPVDREIRNTQGPRGRGIGPGLDWRGDGGYCIAPSRGSGYWWDPHWNLDTVALADVPTLLLPREPKEDPPAKLVRSETGLSPYAEAALDSACRQIIAAPAGEQEATINGEAFAIGTLAAANGIPGDVAMRALLWAARQVPSYDPRRPWHAAEVEAKVERAFAAGLRRPREGTHA